MEEKFKGQTKRIWYQKGFNEGESKMFYQILENYQPFDQKERSLFRQFMASIKPNNRTTYK